MHSSFASRHPWSDFEAYDLTLAVLGLALLVAALLPRFLWKRPASTPMVLLAIGLACGSLDLPRLDESSPLLERFTEVVVTISLMTAGLKIDRPFSWRGWNGTWRLLAITMPLSIALAAVAGWWLVGLTPAAALLLGALIAPTDPVLASEIQVGSPQRGAAHAEVAPEKVAKTEEDEFRFTLTSEAGLNDGLAFPFTHAAIALAAAGSMSAFPWATWLGIDVFYKLGAGVAVGWLAGATLARFILSIPGRSEAARAMIGPCALAMTFLTYGLTEIAGGYGFVAVFVGAVRFRSDRREHAYHESLALFGEMTERLLTAAFLLVFGATVASGTLAGLTIPHVVLVMAILLIVRPLAGVIGLWRFDQAPWRERLAISFFGVRGVGSFYYLAYASHRQTFPGLPELWSIVSLVVASSIVIHGIAATPVSRRLDLLRKVGTSP